MNPLTPSQKQHNAQKAIDYNRMKKLKDLERKIAMLDAADRLDQALNVMTRKWAA